MEKRKYQRMTKQFPVRHATLTDGGQGRRVTQVEDVSIGGIRVKMPEAMTIGQRLRFAFKKETGREWLPDINGIVAWQRRINEQRNMHETGISFSSDQVGINRVVEELMKVDEVAGFEADRLVEPAYDGSKVTFKLLRCFGWGGLNNLGYFKYPSPFAFLNIAESFLGGKMLYLLPDAQRRLVRKTIELMDLKKGDKVLDVACGKGMSSYLIASSHPNTIVTGFDLLQRNVDASRSLFGGLHNLRFTKDNAMCIGYSDESFDKMSCIEAAFHFPDRSKFFKEAFRILKPGGRLAHVDFAWKSKDARPLQSDEVANLVKHQWEWTDFSTIDEYRAFARSAGFKIHAMKNWSNTVSGPLECTFKTVAYLGSFKLGRAFLCKLNPLLYGLDEVEWEQILKSALAHDHVRRRIEYMALVLVKE